MTKSSIHKTQSLVLPRSKESKLMTIASGLKCLESLEKSDHPILLTKTLLSSSNWYSKGCFLLWRIKEISQGRIVLQLQHSNRGLKNEAFKFWHTPTMVQIENRSEKSLMKQAEIRFKSGKKTMPPGSLAEQVKYGYPTTNMLPTPVSSEARQGYQNRKNGKKGTQESLTTKVINQMGGRDKVTGQLNPMWVEWLMGFPTGWTDLKD